MPLNFTSRIALAALPRPAPAISPLPAASRNGAIDCLRGFSIALVMLTHGALPVALIDFLPHDFFVNILRNGYYGVAMFFVISGFLITTRTLERYKEPKHVAVRDFYVMRVGRIVPGLVLSLSIIYIFHLLSFAAFQPPDPTQIPDGIYSAATLQYHVFFLQRGGGPGMDALAIFWSLSIEEVFYIIFPVLCILCLNRRALVVVLALTVLAGPVYRGEVSTVFRWWGAADLLAMGCLTALAAPAARTLIRHPAMPQIMKLGAALVLAVAFACLPREFHYTMGPTLVGGMTALFLLGCSLQAHDLPKPVFMDWPLRMLAALGALSYELYLVHVIVIGALQRPLLQVPFWSAHPFWLSALVAFVSIIAAFAMAKYYTEPMNRRIRKFYAKRLPARAAPD